MGSGYEAWRAIILGNQIPAKACKKETSIISEAIFYRIILEYLEGVPTGIMERNDIWTHPLIAH